MHNYYMLLVAKRRMRCYMEKSARCILNMYAFRNVQHVHGFPVLEYLCAHTYNIQYTGIYNYVLSLCNTHTPYLRGYFKYEIYMLAFFLIRLD